MLLRVVAEVHDRRPEQAFADDADPPGSAGARVLLVEDDLLDERRAATAVLGRPPETDPVVAAELLLPLPALVEQLVLVAGAAAAAHFGEAAVETVGEPRPRVGTKTFLVGGEVQVHRETRQPSEHGTTGHCRGDGREPGHRARGRDRARGNAASTRWRRCATPPRVRTWPTSVCACSDSTSPTPRRSTCPTGCACS